MIQQLSILSRLAQLQVKFLITRRGRHEGTDRYGNRYYQERSPRRGRKSRRWVVYNGEPDASKVPPEWFGWLHYTADTPLSEDVSPHKPWIKQHQPNLSGTTDAYRPPGHFFQNSQRPHATGDYEPWTPP